MVATGGNTIGAPPRLTGDPSRDTLSLLMWVQELYQAVVLEANVLGTQAQTTTDLGDVIVRLATEELARAAGDTTNSTAIAAEATARATGDATAASAISTEATTRAAADAAEATTRATDDATVAAAATAAILAEGTNRIAGDATITAALLALPGDIAWFVPGVLTGGQTVLRLPVARAATFPAGLTGSRVEAGVAATAAKVVSIQKNGVQFATASFAIGGTVATLAAASAASFNGTTDILSIIGPAVADATLADLGINLLAAR